MSFYPRFLFYFGVSLLLTLPPSYAAPIPATSSSTLIAPDLGRYISPEGFTLNAGQSTWNQDHPPKGIESIATMYKGPMSEGVQAALTVQVEKTSSQYNLKSYVRKWLKDYPRFGFDVLNSQPVRVNKEVAYLLDLVNKDTKKQLRQVIFMKTGRAVILTCRDHIKSFSVNLKDCNEIIRSFEWVN